MLSRPVSTLSKNAESDLLLHIEGHLVDGVLGVLVRAVNEGAAVRVERVARRLPLPLVTANIQLATNSISFQ